MGYSIDQETLSQSKINAYRRCGYAYDLCFNQGLVPRVDRPAPTLGTAVHAGIASGLRGGTPRSAIQSWFEETIVDLKKKFEPTEEEYSTFLLIKENAVLIASRTLTKLSDEKWEPVVHKGVPIIEYAFNEPLAIGHWKTFRGTLDLVAKDRSGMPWLIDFKVRETFQRDETEETNLQMASYQYLLDKDGVEAAGSISFQIANDLPRPPKQNQDGRFSRALIRSSWEMYAATVANAGQDPSDYLDMRDKLSTIEWFKLSKAYRNRQEIQAVWNEIVVPSARRMTGHGDFDPDYTRNFHFINCGICAYRDLCLENLRGGDTEFIKQVRYRSMFEPDVKVSNQPPDFVED